MTENNVYGVNQAKHSLADGGIAAKEQANVNDSKRVASVAVGTKGSVTPQTYQAKSLGNTMPITIL